MTPKSLGPDTPVNLPMNRKIITTVSNVPKGEILRNHQWPGLCQWKKKMTVDGQGRNPTSHYIISGTRIIVRNQWKVRKICHDRRHTRIISTNRWCEWRNSHAFRWDSGRATSENQSRALSKVYFSRMKKEEKYFIDDVLKQYMECWMQHQFWAKATQRPEEIWIHNEHIWLVCNEKDNRWKGVLSYGTSMISKCRI